MSAPIVTAIVSTYNSARFMRGCLEDLLQQSVADELEILVIDSGSQQDEGRICAEFIKKHPAIRYVRTERESLYAAWNRGVTIAGGKYLTNANTDDRHRPDAIQFLVETLEARPECPLAYGDQFSSQTANETYSECASRNASVLRFPEYSPAELMLRCLAGPQPLWRRDAHRNVGMFETRFRIAGDYEFWMRLAQLGEFHHVSQVLGVFYDAPDTISGSNNHLTRDLESLEIKRMYLDSAPWRDIPSMRRMLAAEVFGTGYRYVRRRQPDHARRFLAEAWRLDPFNADYAKTYWLRGVLKSTVGL